VIMARPEWDRSPTEFPSTRPGDLGFNDAHDWSPIVEDICDLVLKKYRSKNLNHSTIAHETVKKNFSELATDITTVVDSDVNGSS
jgi:hypothetical protein